MNKTVEAVKNGANITDERLFEVVNDFDLTTLSLRTSDKRAVLSMEINKCEATEDGYEFSQSCTGFDSVMYQLKAKDIASVSAKYSEEANAFYVTCKLKNDMELGLLIVSVSNLEKQLSDFREMDVYELQEFLEAALHGENEYYCASTRITDVFGFDAKLNPKRVYVNTLDEDWKLHISDDFNTFEVPVEDDSINEFYIREKDSSKKIVVKPYGHSFMEISLLFLKRCS